MIIVINFCNKDWELMLKNLLWQKELDGKLNYHCLLAYEESTSISAAAKVSEAARDVYAKCDLVPYPESQKKTWPAGPNWGWQYMARYVAALHKDSWLWLEADAIPIRKNWLRDIEEEHKRAGKAFSGHFVEGMRHINGSCVYPPVVAEYSQNAFLTEESAWDVVLGADLDLHEGGIMANAHPAHTLFQHCWAINPSDGKAWNGSGELATFKSTHDVVRLVDTTMALFHRNKDGTLIDMLRLHYAHPELAMVPRHTENNNGRRSERPVEISTVPVESHDRHSGEGDTDAEIPTGITVSSPVDFTGTVEILYVTYHKDAEWLRRSLRTVRRWCTGFAGVTVVIPKKDADAFAWMNVKDWGFRLNVQTFEERPGKGMLHHMVMMAGADKLCPKGTTHVLHVDSDVMFKEPITPSEYFIGDKPIYVVRTWESLTEPASKVVSDCIQWRQPTDDQLAFKSRMYTMCRHPTGFPIGFYEKYRKHIERVKNRDFASYMLTGKSDFPQNRMDFTAMGAYAYEKMNNDFIWIDISEGNHLAPRDKQKCYHSHSGITPAIEKEIESFLV